jgi:hypothetical protein
MGFNSKLKLYQTQPKIKIQNKEKKKKNLKTIILDESYDIYVFALRKNENTNSEFFVY